MQDSINNELARWNWRGQTIGNTGIQVSNLINRIESGVYRTKEVEIDIDSINLNGYGISIDDIFDLIIHMKLVERASLKYPIIIDHKGCIIDGRHRLMKAIIKGHKTIKGVKILEDIY